jgi:predicted ABC-type transport system involved in lysophospholipase L1 biosynthesis ATPase subunit
MMLEAREVRKVYRTGHVELPVLRGVSLQVARGAFVAITGPSGAGKSTLLHLLAGLDRPSAGEILWERRPLSRMTEAERTAFRNRTVGIVFQFYHLLPELSALENVMLPGLVQGRRAWKALQKQALEHLDHVGLKARAQHKPSQLSGGELQRVAIARALINHPQVLFCDEPTGNLDSATGAEVAELLIGLHRSRGVSLVLVTHEAELARRADTAIALRDGQIVEEKKLRHAVP